MKILVTGGAGYIGSFFVKAALEKGYEVVILDNLSRGHIEAVPEAAVFEKADLLDIEELTGAFRKHKPDAVVHFAAFAYVGESVENPGLYYRNNVCGSLNLIQAASEAGINKFIFSSTCSVYGNPERLPISEEDVPAPINPYAKSKLMIESILGDFYERYGLSHVILRYFNAAGADDFGGIGESHDPEPHLIPIALETALGKREKIKIFGDDYDTPDGTCVRDYIHVNDLAEAHLKALLLLNSQGGKHLFNLGTGSGYSVKEIIQTAEKITGLKINAETAPRRPGDPGVLVADNKKAAQILGWRPKYDLRDILSTAWKWHTNKKY